MQLDRFALPRRVFPAAIAIASIALSPLRAVAHEAPEASKRADEDPAALFARAETLYREGRYEEAIEILEALIRAHPEPILRFNLGRAYESAGALEPAIAAYRAYLDAAPDAPDRASVEARIERLEARLPADVDPAVQPATVPPNEQPSPQGQSQTEQPRPVVAPWIVAGVGGAGLIVGGVFGGLSGARASEASDTSTNQVRASQVHEDARRFRTVSTISVIAGAALVIAGVTWGLIATKRKRRARGTPSSAGLSFRF